MKVGMSGTLRLVAPFDPLLQPLTIHLSPVTASPALSATPLGIKSTTPAVRGDSRRVEDLLQLLSEGYLLVVRKYCSISVELKDL